MAEVENIWVQEYQSRKWICGEGDSVRVQTLQKDYEEETRFIFDFSERAEIEDGDSISTIEEIIFSPSGLTLTDEDIDGDASAVLVTISGGTSGDRYALRCKVTTYNGYTMVGKGNLEIV